MHKNNNLQLEIAVHLENGRIHRYIQTNPEDIESILDHIQPSKLFSTPILLIGDCKSLNAFAKSMVVRIDLISDTLPNWPQSHAVETILEITPDAFHERFDPERYRNLWTMQAPPEELLPIFTELDLVNGERIFLEVHIKPEGEQPLPIEFGNFIQRIFSSSGMYAHRRGGGMLIVNPATITRMSLYPGMPQMPPGAWMVHRVNE